MKKTYAAKVKIFLLFTILISGLCIIIATGGGGGGDTPSGGTGSTGSGTNTFSVGGTLTGLTGTIVLQLNGGNDLTLTENGAFTFSTQLDDGTAYTVTVLSHPDGLEGIVQNGTGTISGANVTNVLIGCANTSDWTHPENLSEYISLDGSEASVPQVAMDDADNAIIVWVQGDDNTDCGGGYPCSHVYRGEYRNGVLSGPASMADRVSPTGNFIYKGYPQVAMDNNGNAIIVWAQVRSESAGCVSGYCTQIYMSEYRNGTWTDPADINDYINPLSQGARFPQVAMGDDGSAIITWQQDAGIDIMEYRNGSWGAPEMISIDQPEFDPAYAPKVAMDDSGNTIVAYRQQVCTDVTCTDYFDQMFFSHYRNSAWTHPQDHEDYHSFSQQNRLNSRPFPIDIAMDNNGNAIIVHGYGTSKERPIFMSEFRNGAWIHPEDEDDFFTLSSTLAPFASVAYDPQVAMDDNGNAIVTWWQPDDTMDCGGSGCEHIFKREFRSGAWIAPAQLTDKISKGFAPFGHVIVLPQVAMDNNDNAIITWALPSVYDGDYGIYKSEYRNGSWINPGTALDFFNPAANAYQQQVAMSSNGKAIIVWTQADGTTDCEYGGPCYHIYMSVYQ